MGTLVTLGYFGYFGGTFGYFWVLFSTFWYFLVPFDFLRKWKWFEMAGMAVNGCKLLEFVGNG